MSFAKLQAALAAATNEVTVAAANINFDFTLVKYEAPKEYQPLGELLSSKRKSDAEAGATHITARRLGALFEGLCPPTPNLITAYGTRASEIAQAAAKNNPVDYSKTMFAPYLGVDATSIWAAATSSKAALPVHLLNCMLASVFEAPEAISIWVELVKQRRHDIAEKLERGESLPFSSAAAAVQQDISRQKLAEWDASARAWLQTADSIKKLEQTQLRLVLENIKLPVNNTTVVFSSVIDAWKSALTTMENLISGTPQAVYDGAAIVALSAWHLYPDMIVFGTKIIEISMKDELIRAGGVLSLGMSPFPQGSTSGVYWCLSLAHKHYYGQPVSSRREVSVDPKRITFPQFRLTVLGVVLGFWKIPLEDTRSCLDVLFHAGRIIQEDFCIRSRDMWADVLVESVSAYVQAQGEDLEMMTRLVNLGRRQAHYFLEGSPISEPPVFNLLNIFIVLQSLENAEARVALLRRMASRIPEVSKVPAVLRFYDTKHHATKNTTDNSSGTDSEMSVDKAEPNYATAGECSQGLVSEPKFAMPFCYDSEVGSPIIVDQSVEESFSRRWFANHARCHNPRRGKQKAPRLESPNKFEGSKMQVTFRGIELEFLFGDAESAAVFVQRSETSLKFFQDPPRITYDDILWCLRSKMFATAKLQMLMTKDESSVYRTFLLMVVASIIYNCIPDATINVNSLNRPFLKSCFADTIFKGKYRASDVFSTNDITLGQAIGVVAFFEGHDIQQSQLNGVIAISTGDSIYVPGKLVCDPLESPKNYELKRILGNVGRPGVVMLISPIGDLMIRDVDLSRWRVTSSNNVFDGTNEDCFAGTSLHLSFTDYQVPIFENNSRGQRDVELSMQEVVISIRDSGQWVADVDILRALKSASIHKMRLKSNCNHAKNTAPSKKISVIDSWGDILDYPDGISVIKASGNWVARLAATSLLVQIPTRPASRVSICPAEICWHCLQEDYNLYNQNIFIC